MAAPYTTPLAEALRDDVVARFTRYVAIDTQSRRDRERCPSTPGQLELSRLLVDELLALGIDDAQLDENGYVFATVPASDGTTVLGTELTDASFGLIAHVDTTPDAPGSGVVPIIHDDYDGSVITLPRDRTVLDPATMPALAAKVGHDIITASGDTLLGADDKAGVAAIMAAAAHLVAHPEPARPAIRIAFTPDEEIGHGADLFDIDAFGVRRAYTVDGSHLGEIQDESFTAIEVTVRFTGVDIHTGKATGKLVSALRLGADFIAELPRETLTPETSSGRDGFIHIVEMTGDVSRAEIRAIVRDFDEELLSDHLALFQRTARQVADRTPGSGLELDVRRQYRNMRDYITPDPRVIDAVLQALALEGITPDRTPIRGGTDGSKLSERGLPTPNIFNGGDEFHSRREWVSIQDLCAATATLVRLAGVWATRVPYAA